MRIAFQPFPVRVHSVCVFTLLLLLAGFNPAGAQSVVGRISGTVTDTSGSVISGAQVTITNATTSLARVVTTDDRGAYVGANLPVGDYSVTVERQGFKKVTRSGFDLVADGRLTVDFALVAGEVTESVTITDQAGEKVNTTSGEVARVIDREQTQNLALNGRNFTQLLTLIPGSAALSGDQLFNASRLSIAQQAINGNRPNASNYTIDGGFNLDTGNGGSIANMVGIDFIQEVKIQTANFSAEYGRRPGASINVITRGGGNEFHGSVFEFLRNDALDARRFFAPRRDNLRFNNFGYSLGGPIVENKLFFFGGMEWKKIRRTEPVTARIPTRAQRAGDFGGAIGNIAPRITPDGRAIANVYTAMEALASSYVEAAGVGTAIFQLPNPFDYRQDILRLDYRASERHTISGRYIHDNGDLINPYGEFLVSALPTVQTLRPRRGYSVHLSETWVITPTLINEAKVDASWISQPVSLLDENISRRDRYGFSFRQLFPAFGGEIIPDVSVTGFAGFRGPSVLLSAPTTDISAGDNLTIIRGPHTFKTGALFIRDRKDQTGNAIVAGSIVFNNAGNPNSTGNAFADALLGNFRTYTEPNILPFAYNRYTQFEAYFSDNWRLHPKLNLELGARYHYVGPTHSRANNITNFDPKLYDPAKAVRVNPNGTLVANSGNRFNGLIRAGAGVPESEINRTPGATSPNVLAVPAGAERGFTDGAHLLAPRVSFAYSPFDDKKTAIRGGFGVFFDRIENAHYTGMAPNPPFLENVQIDNGNLAALGGATATLNPFGGLTALSADLKVPYTMNFSVSVQRELPAGFFAEASYVGNLGRHLIRQPDINQPSFAQLAANDALPANQRLTLNALRPFKGYSTIQMRMTDANSNYNALQLYAARRKGNLVMTASYTWSKVLTDASLFNSAPEEPFDRSYNYGPASYDRRHILANTFTYSLPFGRNERGAGGKVLSGWEVSGVARFQSGAPLTVTANTFLGNRRADYVGGSINLPEGERNTGRWFNTAAFAPAPVGRRGSAGVVSGPGLQVWDLSVRKRTALTEKVRLRFQADFFNAFNHANFLDPSVNFNQAGFGSITDSDQGRNIQFGIKIEF